MFHIPPVSTPKPFKSTSYDRYRGSETPLVLDNGSSNLRFGFCSSSEPFSSLNVVAKYKERKTNYPLLLFGDGLDLDAGARTQARTPWEGDVLLNFDALEHSLDYAFVKLGIDTPSIEHPILMTERLCSPLHSRSLTSELLFEQYQVPSVAYAIDSLMSLYQNNLPVDGTLYQTDGLVISFNTASTSVIPVLNGKGLLSHAKRIPWGSSQAAEYLLKLVQLKYPTFPARVTTSQSQWLLHNLCAFTPSYLNLVKSFAQTGNTASAIQEVTSIVQFPFNAMSIVEEKSEEELAREKERRKEAGKRLQELAAIKRAETLLEKEALLSRLTELHTNQDLPDSEAMKIRLNAEGFTSFTLLEEFIKKLKADLRRARRKEDDGEEFAEAPSFPLLDIPDVELDEIGLREKRKQRLMKAGFDARMKARRDKDIERMEQEAENRREIEDRESNLAGWAQRLRDEQSALMTRIKDRSRRRVALGNRKSATAQARMKTIATLAAEDKQSKKKMQRKTASDDMFGANDADWAVYRQINIANGSSDEEADQQQLSVIEEKLLQHDPTFTADHTHAALVARRSALLSSFRPQYEEGDVEGLNRIHLNTEKWRVCEAWFSPAIAGVDAAGLSEVIHTVLSGFDYQQKARLAQNIFVTGSPSHIPGLIPKLQGVIRPLLPPELAMVIRQATNPTLDAWKGMAAFASSGQLASASITRAEYEEWGGERIRAWWGGNRSA